MEQASSETSRNYSDLLKSLTEQDRKNVRQIESVQKKIIKGESALQFNLVCLKENLLPGYTNIYIYIYMLNQLPWS